MIGKRVYGPVGEIELASDEYFQDGIFLPAKEARFLLITAVVPPAHHLRPCAHSGTGPGSCGLGIRAGVTTRPLIPADPGAGSGGGDLTHQGTRKGTGGRQEGLAGGPQAGVGGLPGHQQTRGGGPGPS